jgi:DNA-binding NarL/FixJ family response regulator
LLSSSGVLVGRDRECEVLERVLERLGAGSAQVVEIAGEPGIGKTRLFAELARRAGERGLLVLTGLASESARLTPFGPLVDAMDDHLAGVAGALDLDPLRWIFPSLSERWPRRVPAAGRRVERHRLFRAVRALLEHLSGSGLVLALDDLQWADDETVELVAQLVRRPPQGPVLLAFAHRERQSSALLRGAAAAAPRAVPVTRLQLGPLSFEAVETLLGRRGTRSWREALYLESGGNPLYLEALARFATQLPRTAGTLGAMELPRSVETALLAERDALSDTARMVAEAAAVCGEPLDPELLVEVAGAGEHAVLAGVDELVGQDLLRPIAVTGHLAFRHALVRHALYESTPPGRRRVAHARAAAWLQRRGAPVVARAHHVERTALVGDPAAVEVLADAARTVRHHAPATAAQWLRAALGLLPGGPGAEPQRLELLLRLATALGIAGHPRQSRDTFHEALRLLPREQPERRAGAVAFCAFMERLLGRRVEGRALLLAEFAALPDQEVREAATLALELACAELMLGDVGAYRGWAGRALATARRHDARPIAATALAVMAMGATVVGDARDAAERLDEAAALVDGLLDGELAERLDAALWLGWTEVNMERHEAALHHLDRALAIAHATGQALILPHLLVGKVLLLGPAGRLADAAECAEEAVDLALLSGCGEQRASAYAMRCWVATLTGDLDVALRAGAVASRERPEAASAWFASTAARMLAEARLAAGDPDGCVALLDQGGGPELSAAPASSHAGWYELLTRAELARGRVAAAAMAAGCAESAAARFGLGGQAGLALLARAQVVAAREPGAAVEVAAAAFEALRGAGRVLDAARAQVVAGVELAVRGELDEAGAALRAAQATFEASGAQLLARQAVSRRRRLAARAPRARGPGPMAGPALLTRRERQVAALVGEGLANREIGRQLHVADKTVEMHVSNVLAKLGVSSRSAIAGVLARAASAAVE